MAGRYVLIDGYNVIRADPVLSNLERSSLKSARDALARAVAGSSRFLGDKVTIVFDSSGARSFTSTERLGRISMTYPPPGKSADDLIRELARRSSDPSVVVVVSNDGQIKSYCEGIGCVVSGSENLLAQLPTPRRMRPRRDAEDRDDAPAPAARGTEKRGNPRRLAKKARNKHDYRF